MAVPEWPLVGRADELEVLRDLLTGPEPRGVVLAGPPGVGKTRLGQECLQMAERADYATARATATRSAAQLPFGAVAPLLPPARPEPGAVDDRADLLRRSVSQLAEEAHGRPLLLFVDDAHLLDDASATLVHTVAATGAATVLATVLAGEPAPDPIVTLWKDGLAERVELDPLGAAATEELLATVLDGPVDPATAVQFTERCQGNALFLRELVMGALDDGSLQDEGGIWRLGGELSPSARLVEIVEAHLGRLDEPERQLMELAAYGEPLGPSELAALSDPAVAEALERRELLASHLDGRRLVVHLAHPLYGDVVRSRAPALRAMAVAECLADAVEATNPQREEDILRVATWRLMAGGGRPDVLLDGATIARWRYDFPLAERLARAAVEAGVGFDAALLAAKLASLQGRREQAEEELTALTAEAADDEQRGQVAVARFDNSVAWVGHDELRILDDAEATITDPAWRHRLAARRGSVLLSTRGPRAGAEAAEPLLAQADGEALVFACLVGGSSLARLGRLDEALAAADRGLAAQQDMAAFAWYPWWHTVTRCQALLYAGRFADAEDLIAAHHREALVERSAEAQAAFAVLAASSVADRGHVRTAAHRAREALALNQRMDRPLLIREAHIFGALALALAGEADAAAEELAALEELALPTVRRDEVDLLQARAWTAAAAGDLPQARGYLERAAELGDTIGDVVGQAAA
ncbi:MAG TPA: AAA family ATPase, partial [Acidimicrobiales bacterium]